MLTVVFISREHGLFIDWTSKEPIYGDTLEPPAHNDSQRSGIHTFQSGEEHLDRLQSRPSEINDDRNRNDSADGGAYIAKEGS